MDTDVKEVWLDSGAKDHIVKSVSRGCLKLGVVLDVDEHSPLLNDNTLDCNSSFYTETT